MARSASPARSDSSSDLEGGFDFMQEPASFRPATPPPTVRTYKRRKYGGVGELKGPETVDIALVSGHPLWGHVLYPAAIALAQFLEIHSEQLLRSSKAASGSDGRAKNVLELGAGGGLPGLTAALEGAANVIISDFPDAALVKNIEQNVEANIGALNGKDQIATTSAAGFTWGSSPSPLLSLLPNGEKFDLLLLSDLVFNHSQHGALLDTCLSCLTSPSPSGPVPQLPNASIEIPDVDLAQVDSLTTPAVLCFYSHHRPHFADADMGFLALAKAKGWLVTRVWKDAAAGPAFPEDDGDLCVRSTVHGWLLTRGVEEA